jgi:hypothetical protein
MSSSSKKRGPEDFRLRETAGEDDVEGHGFQKRGPEEFGSSKKRGPEDLTTSKRPREEGGDDDVEGHGFRSRSSASAKGE